MEIEHQRHWRKITTRPGSPQRDRVPKEDTRGSMGTKKPTASKARCASTLGRDTEHKSCRE